MPISLIPSFALYCFVSAITPGPANLCSLATAMNYGRDAALRQWRGIFFGFAVISLLTSMLVWSFGTILNRYIGILSWLGAVYILWLAWNILQGSNVESDERITHCSFLSGFFLQLTNVKIIVFCATALTSYVLPYADSYGDMLRVAVLLPFTGPMANLLWLFSGSFLKKLFIKRRMLVNAALALTLAFCAVNIVVG